MFVARSDSRYILFVRQMDRSADELGLDTEVFTFHAGPIIRQEKGYEVNAANLRTGRLHETTLDV